MKIPLDWPNILENLLGQSQSPFRFEVVRRVVARLFLALCFQEYSSSLGGNGSVPQPALGFLRIYHLPCGLPPDSADRLGWVLITGELQDSRMGLAPLGRGWRSGHGAWHTTLVPHRRPDLVPSWARLVTCCPSWKVLCPHKWMCGFLTVLRSVSLAASLGRGSCWDSSVALSEPLRWSLLPCPKISKNSRLFSVFGEPHWKSFCLVCWGSHARNKLGKKRSVTWRWLSCFLWSLVIICSKTSCFHP